MGNTIPTCKLSLSPFVLVGGGIIIIRDYPCEEFILVPLLNYDGISGKKNFEIRELLNRSINDINGNDGYFTNLVLLNL